MVLLFGTAGTPHSASEHSSIAGIERVKELGLDAMELEFVYGVKMTPESAKKVRAVQEKTGIELSVHAPYYINLNSSDRQKLGLSKYNVLQSCRIGALCNARCVAFHPGFYQGVKPETVFKSIQAVLEELAGDLREEKLAVVLAPETTGKPSQFGSLEELLKLCSSVSGLRLTVDFAHLHARSNGGLKSLNDFENVLEKIEARHKPFLKDLHMHVSGINYSAKGERNHLNFKDKSNDFNHSFFLQALKNFKVSGTVICESPSLEADALLLKKEFKKL